ncbi:uncharacterized protein B0J16DRAFT_125215 [Fusarium flagelliforme]|uniref:uncharacterized protein n=1 Tax=Fusarium flagelliforme TaxID=2675880 RepID=UPI001E8CD25E|nr:uncharacterized protein B0J16DRAFT_125215 [Fusarium flagelliforme]KAH7185200.1 hypothetical protein B0J16DRAFT_125215 [Fusarium flagelliforme]
MESISLPSDEPRKDLCMSDPRCRLCLFDLDDDDVVVAYVWDNAFTAEFTFSRMGYQEDTKYYVRIHACGDKKRCDKKSRRVAFVHADCFRIAQRNLQGAICTGRLTFDPTVYEQAKRFSRTKDFLCHKLEAGLGDKLPAEILDRIAEMLVHECATITHQQQSQSLERMEPTTSLWLHKKVYATYIVIDGVRYVKELTNSKDHLPKEAYVTVLKKQREDCQICVAEDHRGIRAVKFCSTTPLSPGPIADAYWRVFPGYPESGKLVLESDGYKLRDLFVPDHLKPYREVQSSVRWASPLHPTEILTLWNSDHTTLRDENVLMASFDCNAKDITGYTVVTDGDNIATVHAHKPGEKARFYAEIDHFWPCGYFIYMPLDKDEYIKLIAGRSSYSSIHGTDGKSSCLAMKTSKERKVIFGAAKSSDDWQRSYPILMPSPEPTQIFFNEYRHVSLDYVRHMAADGAKEDLNPHWPPLDVEDFPAVCTKKSGPWFKSSCSTQGIIGITLCRDLARAHKPIIGLLAEYKNGHRECLGQFRFDKSLEKVRLDLDTDFYVGTGRNIWSFMYVSQILTLPQLDKTHLRWTKISRDSILEWRSSHCHSLLRFTSPDGAFINHDGQELK